MALSGWPRWRLGFSAETVFLFILLMGALVGLVAPLVAQEADKGPVKEKVDLTGDEDFLFWESSVRRQAAAGAQMVGVGHPFTQIAMRLRGWQMKVWNELEFFAEGALPLNDKWLGLVQDGKALPDIARKAKDEIKPYQLALYNLYNEALINAFRAPPEVFEHSAKDNLHIKFAHMYSEPWRYRGKVVRLEGRLKRLRLYPAPLPALDEGINELCEGWVFGETYGSHPVAVIFPAINKPEGLPYAEDMDRWVSFNGYFICKFKYMAKDRPRETLLLIGPTVTLRQPPQRETAEPVSLTFLYGIVGFVALIGFALLGLSWMFRKGDRQARARLEQMQAERAMEGLDMGSGPAATEGQHPNGNGPVHGREH